MKEIKKSKTFLLTENGRRTWEECRGSGRNVGGLLKAKDLGSGEAAGEGGLLHVSFPADQGGQ